MFAGLTVQNPGVEGMHITNTQIHTNLMGGRKGHSDYTHTAERDETAGKAKTPEDATEDRLTGGGRCEREEKQREGRLREREAVTIKGE